MPITLTHCFITVQDREEALRFYRDAVGLEIRTDVRMGPQRWLTVAAPGGEVESALETPEGRPGDVDALRAVMSQGSLTAVILGTDDVDATFERLTASGAPVVQEPTDQPFGVRDCAVRDPSGNMVRLTSRGSTEPWPAG